MVLEGSGSKEVAQNSAFDAKLWAQGRVGEEMRVPRALLLPCISGLLAASAAGQVGTPAAPPPPSNFVSPDNAGRVGRIGPAIPVVLEWTPPELAAVTQMAEVRNSFVLDRTMLGAAAALLPDSEAGARQSVRKLDGVAIHLYRFHDEGEIDPAQVSLLREAYHANSWKHLVTADERHGVEVHGKKTDLWLAVDGVTVRGGTLLVVTPKSVSLVTFAGDLNPIDLLRLRGHFGIPNFSGDRFDSAH